MKRRIEKKTNPVVTYTLYCNQGTPQVTIDGTRIGTVSNGVLRWEAEQYTEDKTITLSGVTVPENYITTHKAYKVYCRTYGYCEEIKNVDGLPAVVEIRTPVQPANPVSSLAQVDIHFYEQGLGTTYTAVTSKVLPKNSREIEMNYVVQNNVDMEDHQAIWLDRYTRLSYSNSGIVPFNTLHVNYAVRPEFMYNPRGYATYMVSARHDKTNRIFDVCELTVRGENP